MSTDRACVAMEALLRESVQFQNTRLSGNASQSFIDLKITYLRHAFTAVSSSKNVLSDKRNSLTQNWKKFYLNLCLLFMYVR